MRENLYDVHSNYLYCIKCIVHSLGVHTQRLARQRQIKVRLCQEPVATITKEEVVAKNLKKFVLHPGVDESTMVVSAWWKILSDDSEVEVKMPHERHSLAGKASNKSKPAVRDAFLKFVDANSHPNGHQAGSYSPQFYFTSQRIDPPKMVKRILRQRQNHPLCGCSIVHKPKLVEVRVQHLLLVSG